MPRIQSRRLCAALLSAVSLPFLYFVSDNVLFPSVSTDPQPVHIHIARVCDPVNNVFFFKTHKTGSSTVFNIFLRYAEEHNRTVVVPAGGTNLLNYPKLFKEEFMFNYSLIHRRPEIFAVHTRLDINEVRRVMPNDTKFVTIVRHPTATFESGYSYFMFEKVTKLNVSGLVSNPQALQKMKKRIFASWFGFNQLYYDLGFTENFLESPAEQAQRAINLLEKNFDVVLVAELMEESLILLKDKLCWDLESVVSFRHNERNASHFKKILDEDLFATLQDLNSIDFRIYRHFLDKLLANMHAYGDRRMFNDVQKLKERNHLWYNLCVSHQKHGYGKTILYVPTNNSYPICNRLIATENGYLAKFRRLYKSELKKLVKTNSTSSKRKITKRRKPKKKGVH